MKIYKSLILAAAAAAAITALCACDKEIIDTPQDPATPEEIAAPEETAAPVFTATIEPETKTTLGLNSETGKYTKVNWEITDEISVNGTVYTVAPGNPDATTATLTKKNSTDASPTATFKAIYPASLYNNGTYELPATQTYTAGKFNMPMYAENSETSLAFKNICAVLAVTVPSGDVKKIKVVSDKRMHGAFTVTSEGVLSFTSTEELVISDRTVTLNCGDGVSASNTTFYIAIPAQTYAYLNIYLSADGTTYKEAMATRKPAGLGTLARNTIYPINYVRNAVQLYENGPYFAEFNLGSTITSYANVDYHGFATDDRSSIFGGLYCWGCKEDVRSSTPTNLFQVANLQGSLQLPDEYDVASASWGANWKIPSNKDIQPLFSNIINDINNGGGSEHFDISASNSSSFTKSGTHVDWNYCDGTTVKYVDSCTLPGYKITGNQAGYTGNSIFLPYTGRRVDGYGVGAFSKDCNKAGYYWLSSCYFNGTSVSPYYLSFVYESRFEGGNNDRYTFTCTTFQYAFTQNKWEAYAVRPVLR